MKPPAFLTDIFHVSHPGLSVRGASLSDSHETVHAKSNDLESNCQPGAIAQLLERPVVSTPVSWLCVSKPGHDYIAGNREKWNLLHLIPSFYMLSYWYLFFKWYYYYGAFYNCPNLIIAPMSSDTV